MWKNIVISRPVLDRLDEIRAGNGYQGQRTSYDATLRALLGIEQIPGRVSRRRPPSTAYAPLYSLRVNESAFLDGKAGAPALAAAVRRAANRTGFRFYTDYKPTGWLVTRVA